MTTPDLISLLEGAEEGSKELPFWSDDFDMDLPKAIPDAKALLGSLANVEMWTQGHRTHGRLNHPNVWYGDRGLMAFFGFKSPSRPEVYYGTGELVRCTAWEAFRDAWPHHYLILLEGKPVWNTEPLWPAFETIMWHIRGWRDQPEAAEVARGKVRGSIMKAVERLAKICEAHSRSTP